MPALRLDAALVDTTRRPPGQRPVSGPGPVLRRPVLRGGRCRPRTSRERVVDTAELTKEAAPQTLLLKAVERDGRGRDSERARTSRPAPPTTDATSPSRSHATTPYAEFAAAFLAGDDRLPVRRTQAWHKEQR